MQGLASIGLVMVDSFPAELSNPIAHNSLLTSCAMSGAQPLQPLGPHGQALQPQNPMMGQMGGGMAQPMGGMAGQMGGMVPSMQMMGGMNPMMQQGMYQADEPTRRPKTPSNSGRRRDGKEIYASHWGLVKDIEFWKQHGSFSVPYLFSALGPRRTSGTDRQRLPLEVRRPLVLVFFLGSGVPTRFQSKN